MFTGSLVALITPFKNGAVDEKGFEKFVAWQIKEGTDGLVPCGTTGESPTLSMEEHKRVIDICIAAAKGSGVPVIAGTGSNSTAEAIELTQHAKKAGADAAMLVVPYYNKPTQEGLYQHFRTIAEAVDIPQILYNVPGRTGVDLLPETVAELAKTSNIVGIKEATGSMKRLTELQQLCPADFMLLSGDDASAAEFMLKGGHGVISVTTNIAPKQMAQLCHAALSGDVEQTEAIDKTLQALHRDLFIEANPIPAKWALHRMALITSDEVRLPLTQLEPIHGSIIEQALTQAGIEF